MTADEVTLSCRQILRRFGTHISAVGSEDVEVGVFVFVGAQRTKPVGVRLRLVPVANVVAFGWGGGPITDNLVLGAVVETHAEFDRYFFWGATLFCIGQIRNCVIPQLVTIALCVIGIQGCRDPPKKQCRILLARLRVFPFNLYSVIPNIGGLNDTLLPYLAVA